MNCLSHHLIPGPSRSPQTAVVSVFCEDFYEALRNGPGWERTLFLVVYDDPGGTYDHVVPPSEDVPADDAPCRAPCADFDFKRLGLRTAAMGISPWIPRATVVQEPQPPFDTHGECATYADDIDLT